MPALPPYPNVLKVRTLWTVGADSDVGTTLHFKYTGTAPSDATCTTLATSIYTAADTNLAALVNTANTLDGVQVQDLSSATAGFGEHLTVSDGSRAGEPLPAQTCLLYSSAIARRYRGGKPRTYWCFGSASDVLNPSAWDSSFVSAAQGGLDAYIAAISALSSGGTILGEQVSISYYSGFTAVTNPITGRTRDVPTVRSVAIAPDPVLSNVARGTPATQRRRSILG
jgi:hypothetical protein